MREVFACAIAGWILIGCAPPSVRPAPELPDRIAPRAAEVRDRLVPPQGECLAQARRHVARPSELLAAPLPAAMRKRVEVVLEGLHPVAKQVLLKTHGIWFAENIPGAAAVFLPCDVDRAAGTGGFVLIDLGQFPLDRRLRDAEVPALYWRSLAGSAPPSRPGVYSIGTLDQSAPTAPDHAMRYLVLHELGHAFSLHTGEFSLDDRSRMQVTNTRGFVGLSWRMMTTERKYLPLAGTSPTVQAVVPRKSLDTFEWGSVLAAQGADAALLAPGWALTPHRSAVARAREVCAVVSKLPQAGFVTPTAARYPTEDFAEMFAHAILANEGKLRPTDRIPIDLPGCGVREIGSPYFAPALAAKRRYMERMLGFVSDSTPAPKPARSAK